MDYRQRERRKTQRRALLAWELGAYEILHHSHSSPSLALQPRETPLPLPGVRLAPTRTTHLMKNQVFVPKHTECACFPSR